MLTIQNYSRLSHKPIGKKGWEVTFINELSDSYEIMIDNYTVLSNVTSFVVYLQRVKTQIGSKGVYRFTDAHGTPTQMGVTADYIGNINNLLKSLEHFLP